MFVNYQCNGYGIQIDRMLFQRGSRWSFRHMYIVGVASLPSLECFTLKSCGVPRIVCSPLQPIGVTSPSNCRLEWSWHCTSTSPFWCLHILPLLSREEQRGLPFRLTSFRDMLSVYMQLVDTSSIHRLFGLYYTIPLHPSRLLAV